MLISKKHSLPAPIVYGVFGILVLLAIVLRVSLFSVQTSDYKVFLSQWYSFIQAHGGFAALKYNFANYNVPYLYLLAITTYLPIPKLLAIKGLSALFDGVLGLFTYLILRLRYQRSIGALAGVLVVLFAPTVFINSSAWGQCDAIYTSFCLGSLYFLLKERPGWACTFFGLALSFKLQAIFFLPVLLVLVLKKRMPLKYLALIPLIFLLLLVPAFIAGRDVPSLLSIYVGQVTSGGSGGMGHFNGAGVGQPGNGGSFNGRPGGFNGGENGYGQFRGGNAGGNMGSNSGGAPGQFAGGGARFGGERWTGGNGGGSSSLTLNAPSMYQWFPAGTPDAWKWLGIMLAGLLVVGVSALVWRSKVLITSGILLKITLVFALAIPFLLPEMHERYFFLADVLSILYAFTFPRRFYLPIVVQLCSLLSYSPYFLNKQVVGLGYVACAVLVVTCIASVDLVRALYPQPDAKRDRGVEHPEEGDAGVGNATLDLNPSEASA